jgi:hypothetical protein
VEGVREDVWLVWSDVGAVCHFESVGSGVDVWHLVHDLLSVEMGGKGGSRAAGSARTAK